MSDVLPKRLLAGHEDRGIHVSPLVIEAARLDVPGVYARLGTRAEGLSAAEARAQLDAHGANVLARDQPATLWRLLWRAVINPLVILLAVLATV